MLDTRGFGVHGSVEVERTIDDAAHDLPAVGHLGEDRSIRGRGHFRVHHLDRRQDGNLRCVDPHRASEADGVLADVALLVGVWRNIQGGVGDNNAPCILWGGNQRAVAEQPPCAQLGFLIEDRMQKHIGVQTPLHQSLDFAGARRDRGRVRRLGRIGDVNDLEPGYVEVHLRGNRLDFLLRPEQDRRDQPVFRGIDGAADAPALQG